jgi:hypothetical protein
MKKFWGYLTQHPYVLMVLACMLCLALGVGIGRYATPAKVVEKEKIVTVTKTDEKEKTQTHTTINQTHDEQKDKKIHRVVVETKHPDGTSTKTTTEDINNTDDTHDAQVKTEIKYVDREVVKWQDRIVDKESKQLKGPDWHVYAGVGVSIPHYLGQPDVGVPGLQGWVVQAGAERRILGPVWGGVFLNTQGTIGITLGGVW